MEEKGIGRPSTYATIMNKLTEKKRAYVKKEGKFLVPNEISYRLIDFLVKFFPDIMNISFTATMEDSLDDIGEGGNTLSTGEKQLLSFARALLADPRIFVLDEATSSVDTVTERLIQDAIEKVMAGRTSFIIAHRLSTIRRADVILVVHGGKIIESGTHRSLMNAKGAYYQLYTHQYREEQTRSMMD